VTRLCRLFAVTRAGFYAWRRALKSSPRPPACHVCGDAVGTRWQGANAEHMRDGIRVPPFGEHRNGDDAANSTAKLTGLPDGVHDLAQQFLVCDVVAGTGIPAALHNLAAKAFNLISSHTPEVVVERIASFEAARCQ